MSVKKYLNLVYKGADNRESPFDLYLADNTGQRPLVIFVHGYKGFKDWGPWHLVAEAFAKSGFDFLKFNFSHNGGTVAQPIDFPDLEAFGKNTYSKELEDIAAITHMARYGITHPDGGKRWDKIALLGHSRGGGISILHAAKNPAVMKLVTWASVADYGERFDRDLEKWEREGVAYVLNVRTKQEMPHRFDFYADYKENKAQLDILAAAKKIEANWLIAHGTDDETVTARDAKRLHEANPKAELYQVEGAGHTFGASHPWNENELPVHLKNLVGKSIEFVQQGLHIPAGSSRV